MKKKKKKKGEKIETKTKNHIIWDLKNSQEHKENSKPKNICVWFCQYSSKTCLAQRFKALGFWSCPPWTTTLLLCQITMLAPEKAQIHPLLVDPTTHP